MNQKNDKYDPFDPTGVFKEMRDNSLDAWAKTMVELVNTDAYAEATGTMLDAWLARSGPFRKVIENSMNQTLTNLNLPTRDDVTRLAERLTNIEMRLDDLDARISEGGHVARETSKEPAKTKPVSGKNK